MKRLSSLLLALTAAAVVVGAGRAWNPGVEEWTAEAPAGWRGFDGPGFTLALPSEFSAALGEEKEGARELVVRGAGAEPAALHVLAVSTNGVPVSLDSLMMGRAGISPTGQSLKVRLGPLTGTGKAGEHPTGERWKAAALDPGSAGGLPVLRSLVVIYHQVPALQQPTFDRILGSIRPLPVVNGPDALERTRRRGAE